MRAICVRTPLAAIFAGAMLVFAPAIEAGEEVTLNRWKETLVAKEDREIVIVDAAAMSSFCRDGDGCQVTLRLEGTGAMAVDSTRLFLSETDVLRWALPAGVFFDDSGGFNDVLFVDPVAGNSCRFSDADVLTGDDIDPGFTLIAVSTTIVTCVLVLID